MTKSKSTALLEYRREPTLESKAIVDTRVLFNNIPQNLSTVSYTVDWFDPFILCKSNAYEITVHCKLPEKIQDIIDSKSAENLRVIINLHDEYMMLMTTTYFQLYSKKSNVSTTIPVAQQDMPLLFDIHVQTDSNDTQLIKIITVDRRGHANLFVHRGEEYNQTPYKVPFYRQSEHTASVKWVNANEILIGSSTGQLYLLNISSSSTTTQPVLTLYKERIDGILDIVSTYYKQATPHVSEHTLPRTEQSGFIVNISVVDSMWYICSQQCVSLWTVNTDTKAELVANFNLQKDIVTCILPHVPPKVKRYTLECEIVDMDIKNKEELVLLVSYTVPELSDYLQYAVIKFGIQHNNNDTVLMHAKHTASLPYSALYSPLSKRPQLHVTNDIAFVSFVDTVVARSLNKESVFEESLVLKDKSDCILSLYVVASSDNIASAMVVTAKSDVLEFRVNIDEIQESSATGNIYAAIVDNILERDTMVFKSRLEQALFFGAYKESPLRFPLVVEHKEDVGSAVMEVTNEILAETCPFLPKALDSEISFIESRFYFQNHMYKILQDHTLDRLLSKEQKSRLFELVELYNLSRQLWKIIQEKSTELEWIDTLAQISQSVVKTSFTGKLQLDYLLRNHIYKIKEFLAQIAANSAASIEDDIMPRIIRKCRSFEEKNMPRYDMHEPSSKSVSAEACEHLVYIFNQKVRHLYEHSTTPLSDVVKQKLQDSASLLLQIYSSQSDVQKFIEVKNMVIEGLCMVGLYQTVVDLADKYGDIARIVTSVLKLNLSQEEFKKNSKSYIERFGYSYFDLLLKEIDDHHREDVWYFCEQYPGFAESFFSNKENLPKLGWKYHVRRENFKIAYKILLHCQGDMSQKEHDEAFPWIKMLQVLVEKRRKK